MAERQPGGDTPGFIEAISRIVRIYISSHLSQARNYSMD